MKVILANLLSLLKWKNHGQQRKSEERVELEISFIILLAAGLLHRGDRHKRLDGNSRPLDLDKTL